MAGNVNYVNEIISYGVVNQFMLGVQKNALKSQMRRYILTNNLFSYDMVQIYKTLIMKRVLIRFGKGKDPME